MKKREWERTEREKINIALILSYFFRVVPLVDATSESDDFSTSSDNSMDDPTFLAKRRRFSKRRRTSTATNCCCDWFLPGRNFSLKEKMLQLKY